MSNASVDAQNTAVIGDSIAVATYFELHGLSPTRMVEKNGRKVEEEIRVTPDALAKIGDSSGVILGKLQQKVSADPNFVRGKNVILSTGATNDADNHVPQKDRDQHIRDQVTLLLQHGAKNVYVLGVGTKNNLTGYNKQLSDLVHGVNDPHVGFSGPLANLSPMEGDGQHLKSTKGIIAAAQALSPGAPQQVAAVTPVKPDPQLNTPSTVQPPAAQQPAKPSAPSAAGWRGELSVLHSQIEHDHSHGKRHHALVKKEQHLLKDHGEHIRVDGIEGRQTKKALGHALSPAAK